VKKGDKVVQATVDRTEEEKLTQASITVILGGKEYEIRPLVIRDSREWRKKAIGLIKTLPHMLKVNTDDPEQFEATLTDILVNKPDEAADLFFDYAKELDREEIETTATDVELAKALEAVSKLAFPLAESPMKLIARLSQ